MTCTTGFGLRQFNQQRAQLKFESARGDLIDRAGTRIRSAVRLFRSQATLVDAVCGAYFVSSSIEVERQLRWLVHLSRYMPTAVLLRDPVTMKRLKTSATSDPQARLQALLQTGEPPRTGYLVLNQSVTRWRASRRSVAQLPPCWTRHVDHVLGWLQTELKTAKSNTMRTAPNICIRFLQLCDYQSLTDCKRRVFQVLEALEPPLVVLAEFAQAPDDLITEFAAAKILREEKTWPSGLSNSPLIWAPLAHRLREDTVQGGRLTQLRGPGLLASFVEHGGDFDSNFQTLMASLQPEHALAVCSVFAESCYGLCEAQARLPPSCRDTEVCCQVFKLLLNTLHRWSTEQKNEILGYIRRRSCINAIIGMGDRLDKFQMIFVPMRVEKPFLSETACVQDVERSGFNSQVDKIAAVFLQESLTEEYSKIETLTTYTEAVDAPLFDVAITSETLWSALIDQLGQAMFPQNAESGCMVQRLVQAFGTRPAFVSDTALAYNLMLAYLKRRLLITADAELVDPHKCADAGLENSAQSMWYSLKSFPMSKRQFEFFFRFVNHVSYVLLNTMNEFLVARGLVLNAATMSESIVPSSCQLARSLAQRIKRLSAGSADESEAPAVLQINDLALSAFRQGNFSRAPYTDVFSSVRFTYASSRQHQLLAMCLTELSHAVSFNQRAVLLKRVINYDRSHCVRGSGADRCITIRRTHLLDDSVGAIPTLRQMSAKQIAVKFVDEFGLAEMGVDGGGLTREWLTLIANILADPVVDLFEVHEVTGRLIPNPIFDEYRRSGLSETTLPYDGALLFELCGLISGFALTEGMVLSAFEFASVFLNRVLANSNTLDDLKTHDPNLFRVISTLSKSHDEVGPLSLTFSKTITHKRLRINFNLIPNCAADFPVDNDSKTHYCILLTNFILNRVFDSSAQAFRRGLSICMPEKWQRLFDASEFGELLAGHRSVDLEELKENTKYLPPFDEPEHPTIVNFWSVLAEFDDALLKKFCQFVFSFERPPVLGFRALDPKFAIAPASSLDSLPQASTCVHMLKLPAELDREELKRKLLISVNNATGFQFA